MHIAGITVICALRLRRCIYITGIFFLNIKKVIKLAKYFKDELYN